jgi:hypothetical protein
MSNISKDSNQSVVANDDVNDETLAGETFARLLPELEALSLDELVAINLDVPSAVATTLGSLPEIRAVRPQIVEHLPKFDLVAFDKLEDYALALNYANAQYLTANQPPDDLDAVLTEGTTLRETLLIDATALSRRGFVDGNRLRELNGPNGYKNLATDLLMVASVLRDAWSQIQGRTGIQLAELDRAEKLAQRLLRVVGLRAQSPATVAKAADQRIRAFTLLARTYDDARRAVMFLRWVAGDVDSIAPSLYAGRSNGRKKTPEPVPADVASPTAALATTPGAHVASVTPPAAPHAGDTTGPTATPGPFMT